MNMVLEGWEKLHATPIDKLLNPIQRIQLDLCCSGGPQAAQIQPYHTSTGHTTLAPCQSASWFQIALLVYKALNCQATAYIEDLLKPYDPPQKLRSVDKQLLSQPPCRLKSYGERAFCCAVPVVWNNIPHSVKTAKTVDSFKVKLKTHIYRVSFA